MSKWNCPAFENAITFLPNGKIAPCAIIKDYSKDITKISDTNRFNDLCVEGIPPACKNCDPTSNSTSYRDEFNLHVAQENVIQYIDFRNSNLCNLKCRTCGPHASSSWAKEMGQADFIVNTNIDQYIEPILSGSITTIYFAGGEPLINADHWRLLDILIERGLSKHISLLYSTNLTIIEYKGLNINHAWGHFKHVEVHASIDGTGKSYEYLRSGASWQTFNNNLTTLISNKQSNVDIGLAVTLSILNVWFLKDILEYGKEKELPVDIIQLTDPHYFTLNVMPTGLINDAITELELGININPELTHDLNNAIQIVKNNNDTASFSQMIAAVLLADKLRNENLFDMLPFKQYAINQIFKNQ